MLKRLWWLCLMLYALAYAPASWALSFDEARHLLGRTGFSPSFAEIQPYLVLTREQAVAKRLASLQTQAQHPLPKAFQLPYHRPNLKNKSREVKKAYRKKLRQQMHQLQAWWMREMLTTSSPMTENLTLFWHNHFVSSAQKVKVPALIAQQNQILRTYAAGNFRDFVHAMLKNPALLLYLDNTQNRKGKPNENLARELMELFTLGEGHYTEQDVKQAAKALSGYGIRYKTGQFVFRKRQHDEGLKTLFGQTGHWDGDDFVDLILSQPQTARFITQKLWQHYVTTPISPAVLNRLSHSFYQTYEIKPLIKNILLQPAFWAKANRGTQIKSPVQWVVGALRQFELQSPSQMQAMNDRAYRVLINQTKRMGQSIFYPPNVKGWQTGTAWINTSTLLARQGFAQRLMRGMKLQRQLSKISKTNQAWLALCIPKPLQGHFEPVEPERQKHLIRRILLDVRSQLQ